MPSSVSLSGFVAAVLGAGYLIQPFEVHAMQNVNRRLLSWTLAMTLALAALLTGSEATAQALPNPYRLVDGWATLPGGRTMGAVGDVAVDPDGRHIWAVIRCDAGADSFGWECLDSNLDSIIKFDPDGNVVGSLGGGMFIWPHGIDVDRDGNVWVTDAVTEARTPAGIRGHRVVKFSPEGDVLMVLGRRARPATVPTTSTRRATSSWPTVATSSSRMGTATTPTTGS